MIILIAMLILAPLPLGEYQATDIEISSQSTTGDQLSDTLIVYADGMKWAFIRDAIGYHGLGARGRLDRFGPLWIFHGGRFGTTLKVLTRTD